MAEEVPSADNALENSTSATSEGEVRADEPASANHSPQARWRHWATIAVIAFTGLGWPIAGLLIWLTPSPAPEEPEVATEPPAATTATDVATIPVAAPSGFNAGVPLPITHGEPTTVTDLLEQVDLLLFEDRALEAAQVLKYAAQLPGVDQAASDVLYRQAIAAELLGDSNESERFYRRTLNETKLNRFAIASKLGLARLMLQRERPGLAIGILHDLILQGDADAEFQARFVGDTVHLLAQARLMRAPQNRENVWLDDRQCSYEQPHVYADHLLQLVHETAADEAASSAPPQLPADQIDVRYQYGDNPDDLMLALHQTDAPVYELLEKVFAQAKIELKWSPHAMQSAVHHQVNVHTTGMRLSAILDNVLEPLDLVWIAADDGVVTIRFVSEVDAQRRYAVTIASASRSLQEAIAVAPEHPYAAAAYLGLGNVSFRGENYSSAIAMYDTAVQLYPHAQCLATLWLNLAKSHLLQGERDDALQSFYNVVDNSRGKPLEGIGYLYAGRVLLEEGRFDEAVRPLQRAVPRATSRTVRAAAAFNLGVAYLLSDNPRSANIVLIDERDALEGSSVHDASVLLGAMARFQSSTTETEKLRDGRFIVSALSQLNPDEIFGQHVYFLIGQAYDTVGLANEKASVYLGAIKRGVERPVEERMRLQLADYYSDINQAPKALDILEPMITATTPSRLTRGALFRQASLFLSTGQHAESRKICRELLPSTDNEVEKRQLLRTMGKAYEAERDYENAARCFAGLIPASSSSTTPADGHSASNSTVP
ncbi:MAG: tetratricopeptide repeat protein [Planctomycetales bacterium]|nr:tetratricopeptide repeat protein [Planctomycetales bacterium]